MKKLCPICGSDHVESMITLDHIPYFDNCLCESELLAVQAGCGTQNVSLCCHCGFIFNRAFDARNVEYGNGYHAERGGSIYYQRHLKNVAEQINSSITIEGKRILEVA